MLNEHDILDLLQSVAGQPLLFAGLIILTTFVLEDLAITAAALITAQTDISFIVPLSALFIGIILGDIGLYALGKYTGHFPILQRFKDKEKIKKAGVLLDKNLTLSIFTSRFIPGMRLPTYLAVGIYDIPFKRFLRAVIVAVFIWSSIVFYLFYTIGEAAQDMMGPFKYYGIAFAILLFLIGPKLLNKLRT